MIEQTLIEVTGGCHCGRITFECKVPPEVNVLHCNCSICSMTGFIHLIVPHEHFVLLSGKDDLQSYQFGTGKAEHLFCRHCGVKSFYQPRSHPAAWSVNLCCTDHSQIDQIETSQFDGQNWEQAQITLEKSD